MNRRLLVVLIAALPIFAHAKGPNCADRYGIAAWGAVATRGLLGPDPDHSTATFGPSERFPHLPGPTLMAEQYLGRSSKDGAKLYRQVYFVNIYDAQGKQIAEVITDGMASSKRCSESSINTHIISFSEFGDVIQRDP